MRILLAFLRRARALVSRPRLDAELREEIDTHIALRRQELIEAGMDPRDAAFEARRMFGNVTRIREETRDAWRFAAIESVWQDVRYGARLLGRAPLFTLVAVTSIGSGLGGGLLVFTAANAAIFRPLAGAGGADVYRIYTAGFEGGVYGGSSYADYRDFASAASLFSATCATQPVRANVTLGGVAARRNGAIVSPGCFDTLGIRAHEGRLLGGDRASGPEVVISHTLWDRALGGDRSAIGGPAVVNGVTATIAGVAPRGFHGTSLDSGADFWVGAEAFAPLFLPAGTLQNRRHRSFTIYVRLREGVSAAQAESALAGIAAGLNRADPAAWTNATGTARRVTVAKETDSRFASAPGAVPAMLLTVFAAIAVIVSIACVNLATLLLARGAARTKELTIRLALGASRVRILRQLATESLLIAAAGVVFALGLTAAGIRMAEAWRPDEVPAVDLAIDWRVTMFAIAAAALATLIFGLAPGAHVVRIAIAHGIKGRASAARTRWLRFGPREALIVVQVTVSVALLMVSTLFARALASGTAASPGFVMTGVASIGIDLKALDEGAQPLAAARLLEAAATVRDVEAPVLVKMLPLIGSSSTIEAQVDGKPAQTLEGNVVSPGYFSTLSIPLRRGRDFSERDSAAARPVAIASETLARTLFGTLDVVGRTITTNRRDRQSVAEIVGVVADTRYRAINEPFRPVIYLPFAQAPQERFLIYAHARGGGETFAALERAVRAVDPRAVVDAAMPLAARIDDLHGGERAAQWIGGGAGIAQFALVMMAVWALVAYTVERRTSELGVRIALGATGGSVVQLVVRPAVVLIAAGAVLGSAIGIVAATVLQSEFVGLAEIEPAAGVPVGVVLACVAAGAAFMPARRAARVDPIVALRAE